MEFTELKQILDTGTREELDEFCKNSGLVIRDGKVYHSNKPLVSAQIEHWDKRQHVKKINLNSLYGAILNAGCRVTDKRIGQSTTLSGRTIVKGMAESISQATDGENSHTGTTMIYNDTDSVTGDTIIKTNQGNLPIEQLFNICQKFWSAGDKEYGGHDDLLVASYDPKTSDAFYGHINYIYRHKVSKEQWEIADEDGNLVRVTGDHSIMVERDGELVEVKPRDLRADDILISICEDV